MKSSILFLFASLTLATPVPPQEPLLLARTVDAIPNKYIVKLKAGVSTANLHNVTAFSRHDPSFVYQMGNFVGFAGQLEADEVKALLVNPDVEAVELDTILHTTAYVEQSDAPWGLARISHKDPGFDTYIYDDSAGEGTCAYVLDTGIYIDHQEFEGRAEVLANFVENENEEDKFGHGTHCAGTIGGKTYGVAKKAKLFGVKVMNKHGSGEKSGIIAGLDFILEDFQSRTQECPKGVVVSISLGTPFSKVLNAATRALIDAGIFVAVAAGNSIVGKDASSLSPSSEETVCTVAAMNENDEHAYFSNFGSVVDIYAPGVNVLSAFIGDETATKTANGTSMAAPHVAGLAAYLLALNGPMKPQELCTYMAATATSGRLANPGTNTPNLIAFNGNTAGDSLEL